MQQIINHPLAENWNSLLVPKRKEIIYILRSASVPLNEWDAPPWRSIDKLLDSIRNEQVGFRLDDEGLRLETNVAVVRVFCARTNDPAIPIPFFADRPQQRSPLMLYEDHQAYPNGILKRRPSFDGIGETMERGKAPRDEAMRGLREELGFLDPSLYDLGFEHSVQERTGLSDKYKGLRVLWRRHIFTCHIDERLYRGQYEEKNPDGQIIRFRWEDRRQLSLGIDEISRKPGCSLYSVFFNQKAA